MRLSWAREWRGPYCCLATTTVKEGDHNRVFHKNAKFSPRQQSGNDEKNLSVGAFIAFVAVPEKVLTSWKQCPRTKHHQRGRETSRRVRPAAVIRKCNVQRRQPVACFVIHYLAKKGEQSAVKAGVSR